MLFDGFSINFNGFQRFLMVFDGFSMEFSSESRPTVSRLPWYCCGMPDTLCIQRGCDIGLIGTVRFEHMPRTRDHPPLDLVLRSPPSYVTICVWFNLFDLDIKSSDQWLVA